MTYTEVRDNLAPVWDQTISTREPVIISRRGSESIVMMPLEEWEGMQETAHLLRFPANARRLLAALVRLERGKGEIMSVDELKSRSGIR